jgi:hypothetical protein
VRAESTDEWQSELERWIRDEPHNAALEFERLQMAVRLMMPWWHSYKRNLHMEHWTQCQIAECAAYRKLAEIR